MPASTSQRRTKPKVRRNSDVILDGFHIVSWMTDALDGIRNTDPRAGSTVHGNSRNY
jgi:hypothetical protein